MTKLKVLEIGPNVKPQAQLVWPEAEIVTMDADPNLKPDIVHDARTMPKELYDQFDHLLASHVLEHIPWWQTVEALKEWVKVVKPGSGCVHVVVPSLEWAAEEILSENPSKAVIPHLYAGVTTPWDVHVAGFTMRRLRAVFEQAGLAVIRARSGPYSIRVLGEILEAEQHYVCGVRRDGREKVDPEGNQEAGSIAPAIGHQKRKRHPGRKTKNGGEEKW